MRPNHNGTHVLGTWRVITYTYKRESERSFHVPPRSYKSGHSPGTARLYIPHSLREEHTMFEATFKITALVVSNGQGQRAFKVVKHAEPGDDGGFLSFVDLVYQQDVYRTLRAGDDLTVRVHLGIPPRYIERTLRFREDGQFVGEAILEPNADLSPLMASI